MPWIISQALNQAYENSRCSQEQAAASLEENSLDGAPFAPSSGNPTPQAFLSPDKMTAFSRLSRFGMTFAPLTASRGEDLLMWYREDFLARTSAPPGREQDLTGSVADYGWKWPESWVKLDPATSSWKTRQCSLLEGLDEFSETWPRWGMMRDGECWGAAMPEGIANEKESGFLPAACASDGKHHGKEKWIGNSRTKRITNGKLPPTEKLTYVWHEADIPPKFFPAMHEDAMNWPIEWTDLQPWEMDKTQEWLRSHGASLAGLDETEEK